MIGSARASAGRHRSAPGIAATAALIILTNAAACGRSDSSAPLPVEIRDSAGIELVENHVPAWSDEGAWRLAPDPDVVISGGDADGPPVFLNPVSLDVDSRGRLIVSDGFPPGGLNVLLVFDSLGELQYRSGREGPGPGEFIQLTWADVVRGDSIVAYDIGRFRLSVFGPDGQFAREIPVPTLGMPPTGSGPIRYAPGVDQALHDGSFLAFSPGTLDVPEATGPTWVRHAMLRVAPDGQTWDTVGVFRISELYWTGERSTTLFFGANSFTAAFAGLTYLAPGKLFEIEEYGPDGLQRVMRRDYTPPEVSGEMLDEFEEWYLDMVRESEPGALDAVRRRIATAEVSEHLPALSSLLVDDLGNLWAEEFRWLPGYLDPSPTETRWSVFDPDGRWLGEVTVPARFVVQRVTDDHVLGFSISDLGVRNLESYRLVKP